MILPDSELPLYRPGVGIMLLNRDGPVFVGRRIDMPAGLAAWQMPQGGIDPGETPREAAFRELREEIGTDKAEILGETESWLHYDLPAEIAGNPWGGRYRGQRQKWFAMRFTGRDGDIDPPPPSTRNSTPGNGSRPAPARADRAVQAPAVCCGARRIAPVLRRQQSPDNPTEMQPAANARHWRLALPKLVRRCRRGTGEGVSCWIRTGSGNWSINAGATTSSRPSSST